MKINEFLPVLDETMDSGFVTLEERQVLQYGLDKPGIRSQKYEDHLWTGAGAEVLQYGTEETRPLKAVEQEPDSREQGAII